MPFKKGQSGNPSGRPKVVLDIQTRVRAQTKANIDRMIACRDQDDDRQLALRAAIALHEIAWGKPNQAVAMTGSDGGPLRVEVIRWANSKDEADHGS
jgi:hypothetical protein